MKLYELSDQINQIQDMIDRGEVAEEDMLDTIEAIELEWVDKVDALCSWIKDLNVLKEAIIAEKKALEKRAKALENQVGSIKNYLTISMQAKNENKFISARNKVSFINSTSVEVENEDEFIAYALEHHIDDAVTCKQVTTINKTVVGDMLKQGEALPFVRLEKKANIQVK